MSCTIRTTNFRTALRLAGYTKLTDARHRCIADLSPALAHLAPPPLA